MTLEDDYASSTDSMETGDLVTAQSVAAAPNGAALLALMERTSYSMIQENGQRKYGGPPPIWDHLNPPRGCEIFVGKIPRDCFEDELVPVFEKIGYIYEMRLMMDFSGSNRGYAFVMYTNKSDTMRAVREMNNFEIRKGRFLGVCLSVDNCRLFVGGIPKNKKRDEILVEMKKITEGVVDVIVYPSAQDKTKNRGFAFVEYENHRAAAMARRKLIPGRIQLWGHQIAVDWAEPEQEVDEDIMKTVKILYVRNLMLDTTEATLEQVFNQACGKENAVERVKKLRDYAFVHYREREDALNAMKEMNGADLEGTTLEVVLAKPVDKNDQNRANRTAGQTSATAAAVTQQAATLQYAALDPTLAAYYSQFGFGIASPAALAATGTPLRAAVSGNLGGSRVPVRGRGRTAAGSRAAGGRGLLPGYQRGAQVASALRKGPPELLEEYCLRMGWGSPLFQLHSTIGREGQSEVTLFLYKVTIPALAALPNAGIFQPAKLSRSIEEARTIAAEATLMSLGLPLELSQPPMANLSAATALATGLQTAQVPAAVLEQPASPMATSPGLMTTSGQIPTSAMSSTLSQAPQLFGAPQHGAAGLAHALSAAAMPGANAAAMAAYQQGYYLAANPGAATATAIPFYI